MSTLELVTTHVYDADAVCKICGFDGAEHSHWRKNTYEGQAADTEAARVPLCQPHAPGSVLPDPPSDYDHDDDGDPDCPHCGGEGTIITCCDDLCHGQGWCLHGDGQQMCKHCNGEGTYQISGRPT